MKYKYSKLYWFLRNFEWMRVYFSPFKFFFPKLYVGETAIGCPYFLPRKLVKATPKRAIKATVDYIIETRAFNKRNPEYKRPEKAFRDIYADKMRCLYSVPKKIGFDFVPLRWKTKWTSKDFRQESNPVWSFVCFGYQIALIFRPEHDIHYFECWLFYNYATDKSKSTKERIQQARKEFPCVWTQHSNGEKITKDYWNVIIK